MPSIQERLKAMKLFFETKQNEGFFGNLFRDTEKERMYQNMDIIARQVNPSAYMQREILSFLQRKKGWVTTDELDNNGLLDYGALDELSLRNVIKQSTRPGDHKLVYKAR